MTLPRLLSLSGFCTALLVSSVSHAETSNFSSTSSKPLTSSSTSGSPQSKALGSSELGGAQSKQFPLEAVLAVTRPAWIEEWQATASTKLEGFPATRTVYLDERILVVLFIQGAKLNSKNQFQIECDYQIIDPKGTVVKNDPKQTCLDGPTEKDIRDSSIPISNIKDLESLLHRSPSIVNFAMEEDDAEGRWTIKVTLHDKASGQKTEADTFFHFIKRPAPPPKTPKVPANKAPLNACTLST